MRDVLVVGGGQAGLAMAHALQERGQRPLVVDAGASIGESWRARWDSLRLFTSARYSSLPGHAFPGRPSAYPTKDETAEYLRLYARAFGIEVRLGTRVASLTRKAERFAAVVPGEVLRASSVVVATGPFQIPVIPSLAEGLGPEVKQVHSSAYRNPEQLGASRVLVVGGGNSGFQIAEELAREAKVDLALGRRLPHLPQRLLGRDIFWWLDKLGIERAPRDSWVGRRVRGRADPVIGTPERRLRELGVRFRSRCTAAAGREVTFEDGTITDVEAVVWATGYRLDHSWIDIPSALDEKGSLVHERGATPVPGLYALGLPWLHTRGSALIGGVGDDAAFLADRIAAKPTGAAS